MAHTFRLVARRVSSRALALLSGSSTPGPCYVSLIARSPRRGTARGTGRFRMFPGGRASVAWRTRGRTDRGPGSGMVTGPDNSHPLGANARTRDARPGGKLRGVY